MSNTIDIIVIGKNLAKPALEEAKVDAKGLGGVIAGMSAAAGVAMVAVGVEAVKMGSKFDSEMTRLNTQAGVSKDKLAGLSKGVLELAGQVGQNPDSLAESLYHVESNMATMGITSQKALEMVKVAAQGASVGNADLVDVTNALTAAVASGIPGVQNLQQAMGVLNATVGAGDMSMQDLADAFSSGLLATVKGFGLSMTDVGAALATFGDNNIRGANAATQLRMAVQAMAKPVQGGAEVLEKMGLSSNQLAKDMQSGGLLKALEDLKGHMDKAGISANQQGEIITDAFGRKAGTGINVLIGQLDRVQSKYPELEKGANKFGDAWSTTAETTQQKWKDLKASWDALLIRLGEGLEPVAKKVLDGLNKLMQGFNSKKFQDEADKISKSMGAIWKEVRPDLEKIIKDYQQMTEDLQPKLQKFWEKYGPTIEKILKDIGKFTQEFLVDKMKLAFDVLSLVVDLLNGDWGKAWKDAKRVVQDLWNETIGFAKSVGQVVIDLAGTILKWLVKEAWNGVKRGATDAKDWVVRTFNDLIGWIAGVPGRLYGSLAGAFNPLVSDINWVKSQISGAFDWIERQASRIKHDITSIPGAIGGFLGFAHGGIVGAATGGPRGNLVMVGEQGPELVRLPYGSQVSSTPQVQSMMASGGGGGVVSVQLEFVGNPSDELVTWLRKTIRVKGSGNVQNFLGSK